MDDKIARQLAKVVREIYNSDERELLTVNYARQVAEKKLKLDEGFLKEGDWKAKSKKIIHDTLNEVEATGVASPEEAAPAPKRKADTAPKRSRGGAKRPKKSPVPSDTSDASEGQDSPEPPMKKRKTARMPRRRNEVASDGSHDEDSDAAQGESDQSSPKPSAKSRSRPPADSSSQLSDAPGDSSGHESTLERKTTLKPAADDDDSKFSSVVDEPLKPKQKSKAKAQPNISPPPTKSNSDNDAADSSGELSSVVDEPSPPPRRKRKTTKGTTAPSKSARPAKSKTSSATTDGSPDEVQIKTLQSQLAKCGVRKVWGNEFKKHGADTPEAKIQHLKNMLVEIGMTGRFSEAKARQLKGMRELQTDLQDVLQWEKRWGVGGKARAERRLAAARRSGTNLKGTDTEGSEGGEHKVNEGKDGGGSGQSEGSSEEGGQVAVHRKASAKHLAVLAFLEDDSESELE